MSIERLSPTSYLVLGLLAREGPSTPYDLEQHVQATLGNFWSFPHTLLYSEPPRLAALGLVTETRVLLVGRKLCLMDRELPLGETQPRLAGREIGEEELEESGVAKLSGRARRLMEPGRQSGHSGRRDGEVASTSALRLACLRDQTQGRQARRLAVQERVRERPEVPERGLHVLLEVVRRRWPLAGEEPEDEI